MTVSVQRPAGAALLHPLAVCCSLVLVANDHVLKQAYPGFVTGKLSDFSGVLLMPLFLHAAFEILHTSLRGQLPPARLSNHALASAALLTAVAFALPELGGPCAAAYQSGLGALQWPFRALFALLEEQGLPPLQTVQATADLTDLAALPMALLAYFVGRRGERALRLLVFARASVPFAFTLSFLTSSSSAEASEPSSARRHDGFFMSFAVGTGVGFVDSTASISNGFRQSIPSTARGVALPTGALTLGGTLPRLGLVLGGRLGISELKDPVLRTLGQSFQLRDFRLQVFEIQGLARWYPDPARGLHVEAGVGGMSVEREGAFSSALHRGYCFSLAGGYDVWVARQWSIGVDGRFTAGRLSGDEFGKTTVILPTVTAEIVFH
jgi:hypothetical protein